MGDQYESKKRHFAGLTANRRLKLWEVRPHFHCAILGTCLSMEELRKVMRQSGVEMENQPSHYDLHTCLVTRAEEKNRASRNLHKMLDQKYKRWIQVLSKCRESAELEQHWKDAMESGDIAGVFWALMTHPNAAPELIRKSYGDVHMLSHLQGAANRADLKQMKSLEGQVSEFQEVLGKVRQNMNEQITRRDALIRQQEQELLAFKANHRQFKPENNPEPSTEETNKQIQILAKRVDWVEGQLAERDMCITGLREELAGSKELLDEAREEHAAMEQTLTLLLAERSHSDNAQDNGIDLQGKRILYVGGRSALAPHLRSLVEAHNGRFDHHDGGLEDSRAGLQCTLAGADLIFCPVDCISHDACRRVKRHCQQQAKQFVPLRSSGLSAFAAGLRQYLAMGDEQPVDVQAVCRRSG